MKHHECVSKKDGLDMENYECIPKRLVSYINNIASHVFDCATPQNRLLERRKHKA